VRRFYIVILLAVPFLVVGCLPIKEVEAGVGLMFLGFGPLFTGLICSWELLKVQERKTAARLFLAALYLIGGGLMALGAWVAGWLGQ
jgi:hypothetical protein